MRLKKTKKIIKKLIPKRYHKSVIKWKNFCFGGYAVKSYSLEGEDLILRRIFEKKKTPGFYIDVGAYHPKRYSNSYYFYKEGWRGINIDAMPGSMVLFKKVRPRDINLEIAISDTKEVLTYYLFNESALNGFSKIISDEKIKNHEYKIINEIEMETFPLADVLDKYLPEKTEIDFLSVDVEGFDLKVLLSNDWNKYKPKVTLVESWDFNLSNPDNFEIYEYLSDKGYYLTAKTVATLIFTNYKGQELKHMMI